MGGSNRSPGSTELQVEPLSPTEKASGPPPGAFSHVGTGSSRAAGGVRDADARGTIRAMVDVTVHIRWRDMDNYGHVNNAVYLNYLEECRDRLVEALFGADEAWDFVLARVAIDFRSELTQADGDVVVRCAVAGFGRSSIRTRERIEKLDGTLAAEAEAVIVPRSADGTASRPLTERERAVLEAAAAPSA